MLRDTPLTFAICTYGGVDASVRLIRFLLSALPETDEVLLIDNSEDESSFTQAKSTLADTRVHIVRTTPPGLSRARNKALELATHDRICFLDDDVVVDSQWVESLGEYRDCNAAVFGGRVQCVWPGGKRPVWMSEWAAASYAELDLGDRSRELSAYEYVYGANFGVNVRLLGGLHFDESMGRQRGNLLSGEETYLQDRVREQGGTVAYCSGVRVLHEIEASRVSQSWLRRRFFAQGVSDAMARPGLPDSESASLLRAALSVGGDDVSLAHLLSDAASPMQLDHRLTVIREFARHLTSSAVGIGRTRFNQDTPTSRDVDIDQPGKSSHLTIPSTWVAPAHLPGKCLIVEWNDGHAEIYRTVTSHNVGVYVLPGDGWGRPTAHQARDLDTLMDIVRSGHTSHLMFGTLEIALASPSFERLIECARLGKVRLGGWIHRPSAIATHTDVKAIRDLDIRAFSQQVGQRLNSMGLDCLVQSLPLTDQARHAAVLRSIHPRTAGRPGPLRIGLVGELRRGKGFPELVNAVRRGGQADLVTIVPVGAVGEASRQEVNGLARQGMKFDLGLANQPRGNYRAVDDDSFVLGALGVDCFWLVRTADESEAASAVLPLAVACEAPVLTRQGSEVDRLSEEYGLGLRAPRALDVPALQRIKAFVPNGPGVTQFLGEMSVSRFRSSLGG
jgi:GT2 family glycosyltransferase